MDFGVILGDFHIINILKPKMLDGDPQNVFKIENKSLKHCDR